MNDPEQKNQALARAGSAALKNEVKKESPEWAKERREEYLQGKIKRLSKEITEIYQEYERQTRDDVPHWFRLFALEYKKVEEKEKRLGWLNKELRNLGSGKEAEITEDMIEQARNYDITKLIEVKRNFALCPFHPDRRPSFFVKNNFGYCFACGASADSIGLLMNRDGLSFPEAIKALQ